MNKKENIKISIIIPIYNAEKYLEKCIKSVMEQSLKEIEIICINDGSTDTSLKILKKFQKEDNRIKIIDKKNGGASSARNEALKIAKGQYCLNVDSDDWIEQEYLEKMYSRAEKDDLDIVISDLIFDFQFDTKRNYVLKDLKIDNEKIISGKEYVKKFFKENRYGYSCNKLIKRELYTKNDLYYDEKIFLLEDLEILIMLSYYARKIGKWNEAYYHYIQGENNGSYKIKVDRLYDILICMNKLSKFYSKYNEKEIVNLIKQDKYIHLLSRILENNYYEKDKYKEFILIFLKELKQEKVIFKKELLKNKYKFFLINVFKILKKIDPKLGFSVINIMRKFVIFNKSIKGY